MSRACCSRFNFHSSYLSNQQRRNFTTSTETPKNTNGRKLLDRYPKYIGERSWRHNVNNQRKFFEWIASRLQFKTLDDWYSIKTRDILEHGGKGVLAQYNGSLYAALSTIYPSHIWVPWMFDKVPKGFWHVEENHKKYFTWLSQKLGIKELDDWYNVKLKDVVKHRGSGIICEAYGNSLMAALQKVYPEHDWCGWKFTRNSPKGYWTEESRVKWLREVAERLSISHLEDWYRVSNKQLIELGAGFLVKKYGLFKILKEAYPEHPWDIQRLTKQSGRKRAAQRWLCLQISKMLPKAKVIEEYSHAGMKFPGTNRTAQLDVFLPDHALAFEYQGEQHYQDLHYFSPKRHYSERDSAKEALCKNSNITLIIVPFWWNKQVESLAATVLQARPEFSKHMDALVLEGASRASPIEQIPSNAQTTPKTRHESVNVT